METLLDRFESSEGGNVRQLYRQFHRGQDLLSLVCCQSLDDSHNNPASSISLLNVAARNAHRTSRFPCTVSSQDGAGVGKKCVWIRICSEAITTC